MDWFRMYSEFASDPKVQSMSEVMQRRLIMLFCLRCSNTLVTLQDDEIAFALRISETDLAESKAVFMRKGFIDEGWEILNWDKRQFVSDSSAARVARHRAKKKEAAKQDGNVTVTPQIQNRTEADTEEPTNPIGLVVASDAADQSSPPAKPACQHEAILALYHELLPASPPIRDWTPARAAVLRTRWNEDPKRQSLDYWRRFFAYIAESPFLTGRKTGKDGRAFTPGLEWILKAENFAKIREGRYHQEAA
jgi:hypothetical protein